MVKTYSPTTYWDALSIIEHEKCIIHAGGTDIMVRRRSSAGSLPNFENNVLFIHKLADLNKIYVSANNLHIGATATLTDILENNSTPNVLKQAIAEMASPAIRNIGTIGGNICNASPAGDTLPPLIALGARMILESRNSLREMPVQSFITGPGKTLRNSNELLKEVIIPLNKFDYSDFRKVGTRKANALSKLSFCSLYNQKGSVIQDIRLSFGALAPVVIRSRAIEETMIGKKTKWIKSNADQIISAYDKLIVPITDQRSTATYRKNVALSLLQDFIENTLD